MAEDLIRYDILAQDALRGVVRKVLSEVARTGLPGEHHFHLTFSTTAPGVRVSSRLLAQWPENMTIVFQHQYWDLAVTDHAFEVGMSFSGVPERLFVPFTAIVAFEDRSVGFQLHFAPIVAPVATAESAQETPPIALVPATAPREKSADENKEEDAKAPAAQVVSLDAFRKK